MAAPQIISIADGNKLEDKIIKYYYNCIKFKVTDTLSYNELFYPLEEFLKSKSIKRIFFSPDGIYNQLNILTLFDPVQKKYLIDKYEIRHVTSTRELFQSSLPANLKDNKALLIGNPKFNIVKTNTTGTPTKVTSRSGLRGTDFNELPGTAVEIKEISEMLQSGNHQVTKIESEQATEMAAKTMDKANIIHFATHGFFINSKDQSVMEAMMGSGLVLAGVNNSEKAEEDGLLTAYEIQNMELEKVNLVVLSACETGRGEILSGEGVFGLQRALKMAGVQHIIMSLWKVDDIATKELMILFYKNYIAGNSITDSFNKAMVATRVKYPHPYYWGAFILVGR